MKEALKKVFHMSVLGVIGVLTFLVVIFQYIVFPGLTAADSFPNIISFIIGVLCVLFVYHYIQWKDLIDFLSGKDDTIPPGETEYDYLPKEEVIKKKRTHKKKPSKPSVKTKTK